LVALVVVGWEGAVRVGWLSTIKFGQPSRIWFYFLEAVSRGDLWAHLRVTLYEELFGFVLGMLGGSAVGLGLWWSRTLARILEPFIVMFNGIPKIALAPPMIVWFGIYETSKVVLAASVCFVVAWLTTYSGVRLVDRDLLDMIRAVGGSRWQAFAKVVVPSALPWMFAAARINIGFGLVGAVVGEFVASNHGLGFLAAQAAMLFQISRLWMIVLVIVAVAAAQYCGVLGLERYLFRWATDERVRGVT
jgi:NitT/TauT family transport system permease protein